MEVSVRELKNRLSEYLRRAAAGETVTVTSHKRVVAKLMPPDNGVGEGEPPQYTVEELTGRLKSLSWIRWSGGKPNRHSGVAIKHGKGNRKTLAASLLDDRR